MDPDALGFVTHNHVWRRLAEGVDPAGIPSMEADVLYAEVKRCQGLPPFKMAFRIIEYDLPATHSR